MREAQAPGLAETRAMIALAEARFDDAIRLLWQSDSTSDGPSSNCVMCIYPALALVCERAGVADSAIHYWEGFLRTPYAGREHTDAVNRPMAHRHLGRLYETRGDTTRALEHYAAFVNLWAGGDPDLQPQVAEIRGRMSRLRGS
jgi:hypothetical protein